MCSTIGMLSSIRESVRRIKLGQAVGTSIVADEVERVRELSGKRGLFDRERLSFPEFSQNDFHPTYIRSIRLRDASRHLSIPALN
jgi:hypothetical protein